MAGGVKVNVTESPIKLGFSKTAVMVTVYSRVEPLTSKEAANVPLSTLSGVSL